MCKKKICKKTAAILLSLAISFSMVVSVNASEIPISQEIRSIDGIQTLTRVYNVENEEDANELCDEDFELDGYRYSLYSFTKSEESEYSKKQATVSVEYDLSATKTTDALYEALKKVKTTINYEDYRKNPGNFTGVLTINLGTLSVSPVNEKVNKGTKTITKTYSYKYNDNNQIPQNIKSGGMTYSLSSFNWSEGKLDADSLVPNEYICTAIYKRGVTWTSNDGYMATVDYTGTISKPSILKYTAVYHGTEITEGFFERLNVSDFGKILLIIFFSIIGLIILFILFRIMLTIFNSIIRLDYRDEFSGEYRKFKPIYLKKDNKIKIDTTKHPECQNYRITMRKAKADSLVGRKITITADLIFIEHEVTSCYGKKYEIDVNLESIDGEITENRDKEQKKEIPQ